MDEATAKDETLGAGTQAPEAAAPEPAAPEAEEGPNSPAFEAAAIAPEEVERLSRDIVSALKTVFDPEIPADIYELGLIYKVDIDDGRHVNIDMTLTAPGCPVAGEMPIWVENAVASVEGVSGATAHMVFDPPWTPERMSDEAKVAIGWW
ncbi:SUF system Fe-S cluster assembly protein [Afifella sp. IM 167]|uniref:SUF system Fe-S cluster assembly protein n=1 Tax=Afifella sp. IM 167 TaxID=2033586 RepID=UPI001CCFFE79|nr:SUF system Fe-S cluster assembly protein [Afifella sp. IM 167]MBZ8132248.1 SUF system Fe-S cluster assembly protein [Afifella sp. IM 167]